MLILPHNSLENQLCKYLRCAVILTMDFIYQLEFGVVMVGVVSFMGLAAWFVYDNWDYFKDGPVNGITKGFARESCKLVDDTGITSGIIQFFYPKRKGITIDCDTGEYTYDGEQGNQVDDTMEMKACFAKGKGYEWKTDDLNTLQGRCVKV